MISKTLLKTLCAYKQQKQCDKDNLYVVEGDKICREVLLSGKGVAYVAAVAPWLSAHAEMLRTCPGLMPEHILEVSPQELERLSGLHTPNQVWMLVVRDPQEPPLLLANATPLLLVLDRLQNPGNLGTIIRIADWFGLRHIVCSPDTVGCYNPKVVQAAMGSLFRTHLYYTSLPAYLSECRQQGQDICGAVLNGTDLYALPPIAAKSSTPPLLVIGNEAKGISPEVAALLTRRITIPNRGGSCESLNAAVATAIIVSELLRHTA